MQVLLWDLGDTLVDERWMRRPPPGCPGWEEAWTEVMARHADAWNVGRIGADVVWTALADHTGLAVAEVRTHAERCCRSLAFHETACSVARQRRLPQALVTVNPDIVPELVVPAHGLGDVFDVIVASCTEGTDDKSALCDIALDRLGHSGDRGHALLIDNRHDLVQAWEAAGGLGYHFHDDRTFAADLPSLGLPHRPRL